MFTITVVHHILKRYLSQVLHLVMIRSFGWGGSCRGVIFSGSYQLNAVEMKAKKTFFARVLWRAIKSAVIREKFVLWK